MNVTSHDFVTVDMRGLKAALVAHARERRVSVSVVVRDAVTRALPASGEARPTGVPTLAVLEGESSGTMKLSIRLTMDEVRRLDDGAMTAGLSRAAFLSGLIDGVAVLSSGGRRDYLAALISSSSELSTLSRNLRHLADLLRGGELRAAQEYRGMLATLPADVERHLSLAGEVLTQMRPANRAASGNEHGSMRAKGVR